MFCPSCRDEFREGFTHCDECDVELVDALPPLEEKKLVRVLKTFDGLLLSATRSALENAGIPCVVQGEEAQGLLPVEAVVLVPVDREDDARAVVEQIDQPSDTD